MPLNVPNVLTLLRLALVPVFLYLLAVDELWKATVVFVAAGITDALDGAIARAFKQKTEFGANMDPVADKLLLSGAYLMLAWKGYMPVWFCALVLLRDFLLLAGVGLLRFSGRKVAIRPTLFGKLTTVLQIVTVVYVMALSARFGPEMLAALIAATAFITVLSGLDYAWREAKVFSEK